MRVQFMRRYYRNCDSYANAITIAGRGKMDSMSTFGERLKARRLKVGMSQTALAAKAGVGQTTIADIESGRIKGSTKTVEMAAALSCSSTWLATGKGPEEPAGRPPPIDVTEDPNLTTIKKVKFKISAGISGFSVEYLNGERAPIIFRKDWIDRNGYLPENLFAVPVSGQSMEPSLYDGDLIVVNTADNSPRDGDVFVANYEGELVVKRMKRDAGNWWLSSDNSDKRRYPDKRCDDQTFLIGRVIHKQSEHI